MSTDAPATPKDKPKAKRKLPALPELYYEARRKVYWLRAGAEFIEQDNGDLSRRLRNCGLENEHREVGLNDVDRHILKLQDEHRVDMAIALSGQRVGRRELGAFKILVTKQPRGVFDELPKAKLGDFPTIERALGELLPDGQWEYHLAWLKLRLETLREGRWQPSPAQVFVGSSASGKSFWQYLVTQLLGGRGADPWRYLSGATNFNADLAEAEHWAIEELRGSTSYGDRAELGEAIKQTCVSHYLSVHPKQGKAMLLPVWKALSVSCNFEAEALSKLPPMTDSNLNKLCLFKCGVISGLTMSYEENQRRFLPELPAFRAYLLQWKIPAKLRKVQDQFGRFGHDCFWHPEILAEVNGMSPEEALLALIDSALFTATKDRDALDVWTGLASKLHADLTTDPVFRYQALPILSHASTSGRLLARLETRYPQRIQSKMSMGHRHWTITKP